MPSVGFACFGLCRLHEQIETPGAAAKILRCLVQETNIVWIITFVENYRVVDILTKSMMNWGTFSD